MPPCAGASGGSSGTTRRWHPTLSPSTFTASRRSSIPMFAYTLAVMAGPSGAALAGRWPGRVSGIRCTGSSSGLMPLRAAV